MTIIFTDDEIEWVVKEPFNWHIKNGCPSNLKKSIERKLKRLSNEYL